MLRLVKLSTCLEEYKPRISRSTRFSILEWPRFRFLSQNHEDLGLSLGTRLVTNISSMFKAACRSSCAIAHACSHCFEAPRPSNITLKVKTSGFSHITCPANTRPQTPDPLQALNPALTSTPSISSPSSGRNSTFLGEKHEKHWKRASGIPSAFGNGAPRQTNQASTSQPPCPQGMLRSTAGRFSKQLLFEQRWLQQKPHLELAE